MESPEELNNISLKQGLLAALYKEVLIARSGKYPYIGGNAKRVLIMVQQDSPRFLSETDFPFLTRILNACKLSLEDVALFNIAHYPEANIEEWMAFFTPRIVLCFGITPLELRLPVDFPLYQLQPWNEGTFLHTAPLCILSADTEERKKCWASLKRLFHL